MRFEGWLGCVVCCYVLGAVLLVSSSWVPPAHGVTAQGACCFSDLSCQDLPDFDCAALDGQFIGFGTECSNIQCQARAEAPVISILGLVGIVGALGGIGVHRIVRKRRRR